MDGSADDASEVDVERRTGEDRRGAERRGGRPPRAGEANRRRVDVRLTDDEHAELLEAAGELKQPIATFVRQAVGARQSPTGGNGGCLSAGNGPFRSKSSAGAARTGGPGRTRNSSAAWLRERGGRVLRKLQVKRRAPVVLIDAGKQETTPQPRLGRSPACAGFGAGDLGAGDRGRPLKRTMEKQWFGPRADCAGR